MSGKKLGKDAFYRMNFLYEAAKICQSIDGADSMKLSLYYSSHIKSLGRKTQCRMHPYLKRTLCKGCDTILVPGNTACSRKCKKPDPVFVTICCVCGEYKVFRTRKDYVIWPERTESIVETDKLSTTNNNEALNNKVRKLNLEESDIKVKRCKLEIEDMMNSVHKQI